MARYLLLDFPRTKRLGKAAGCCLSLLGLTLVLGTFACAEDTMMMQSAAATNAAKTDKPAPADAKKPVVATDTKDNKKTPAPAPAPPANVPPPVPDTFNRYGKIWAPSDDIAHPIKLNVQFPGVGEMKIPTSDELNQRDKLEDLATLSDDEIRAKLAEWPPFAKMKLADEGQLLIRIQAFKEQRTKIAMDRARDLGLLNSLTPDQKAKFEKEYWDKRLKMDHELAKQFEPIVKAREQKLRDELFREFSTVGTVVPPPPAPKPPGAPAAPAAPPKPGAPATAATATLPLAQNPPAKAPVTPIAQGKPNPSTNAPTAQNPVH